VIQRWRKRAVTLSGVIRREAPADSRPSQRLLINT
jgi:hypothetical protein